MNYDVLGLKNTINYLEEKNASYFGAGLTWENAYRPIILNNSNVIVGLINLNVLVSIYYVSVFRKWSFLW